MAKVKIRFSSIFSNIALAMLIWVQGSGINIDVGVKFLNSGFKPRACNNFAREAAIIPFPKEEETPPVTKIYFVSAMLNCVNCVEIFRALNYKEECKIPFNYYANILLSI